MADPIRVSVYFDAQNRVSLQKGAEDVSRLSSRIAELASKAGRLPLAFRAAETHLNSFSAHALRASGQASAFFGNRIEALYSSVMRFSRYGLASLVVGAAGAAYELQKLGREFLDVNEKFANLEISVGSAFSSRNIGRQIREQLKEITVTSPIPFKDLASAFRSLSFIPQLSRPIGRQAALGDLGNPQGFFRQYAQLIEQLLVFRPDKAVEDATFAIREAATGELRSLIRRFDFPAQLLVNASGRSLDDLKRDPQGMILAIKSALDKVISPEAIKQIALQPTRLFQNLEEQLKEIPLLDIGDAGLYEKVLRAVQGFFQRATRFVSESFAPYAKRISDSVGRTFDSVFEEASKAVDATLRFFGVGRDSSTGADITAGMTRFEKVANGVASITEKIADRAPEIFKRTADFVAKVAPFFVSLASLLARLLEFLATSFERSPILTALTTFVTTQLPHGFRYAANILAEKMVEATQRVRLGLAGAAVDIAGSAAYANKSSAAKLGSAVITPGLFGAATLSKANTTAADYGRLQANELLLRRLGGVQSATNPSEFVLPVPPKARFSGVKGNVYTASTSAGAVDSALNPIQNAALSSLLLRGGFQPVLRSNVTRLPGYFDDPVNRRLLAEYGVRQNAAGRLIYSQNNPFGARAGSWAPASLLEPERLPPTVLERTTLAQTFTQARASGGLGTRLAAGAGQAALGAGLSAGAASLAFNSVAGIAGIVSSVVLPILAVVAGSAILGTIIDKVRNYLDTKTLADRKEFAKSRGLSSESLGLVNRELESSKDYFGRVVKEAKLRNETDFPKIALTRIKPESVVKSGNLGEAIEFSPPTVETTYKTETLRLSVDKAGEYLGYLGSDIDRLGAQLLDFTNADFSKFQLESNPAVKVTADNAKSVYDQLKQAFERSQKAVEEFEKTASRALKFGREQVLTPSQESIYSRLTDISETFTGDRKGIYGYVTGETNRTFNPRTGRIKETPTPFSSLVARLGASRESEEAARLTEDAANELRRIQLELDPFLEFSKVFDEDVKRVQEIMDIRREFSAKVLNAPDRGEVGKQSSEVIRRLVEEGKTAGIRFDYDSLTKAADDLNQGANSAIVADVLKKFQSSMDTALVKGLSNRITQFLSLVAGSVDNLVSPKDSEEFTRTRNNLSKQFSAFVDQLDARKLFLDQGGTGNVELRRTLDSQLGRFKDPTAENVPDWLVEEIHRSNALFAQSLGSSIDSMLAGVEAAVGEEQKGTLQLVDVDKHRSALQAFMSRMVERLFGNFDKVVREGLAAVVDKLGVEGFSGDAVLNRYDSALAQLRAASSVRMPSLKALGVDVPVNVLDTVYTGPTAQDSNYLKAVNEQRRILNLNKEVTGQLSTKVSKFQNGAEFDSTKMSVQDVKVLEEYVASLERASAAAKRFNDIRFNSEQANSFTQLFSAIQAVSNEYDALLLKGQESRARAFVTSIGGDKDLKLPKADVLNLPTETGVSKTTNQLAQLRAIEQAARDNADAFEEMAIRAQDDQAAQALHRLGEEALGAASKARIAQEAITGRGGVFGSFTEGFKEMTDLWKNSAKNFADIGKGLANGLSDSFTQMFDSFAFESKSASEAFADFGKSILRTAINLLTQKAIQSLLGFVFGGVGGVVSSVVAGGVSGSVGGGTVQGPFEGTGEGSFSGAGFASGGLIPGPRSSSDNLVAKVASGEFIIPSSVVAKFGVAHFEAYRRGKLPSMADKSLDLKNSAVASDRQFIPLSETTKRDQSLPAFASGGLVGALPSRESRSTEIPITVSVPVTVNMPSTNSDGKQDSDSQKATAEGFSRVFAAVIDEAISKNLRQGGAIRRYVDSRVR